MHYFPGGSLRLRCDEETEIVGVDEAEMGEFAYDYVGLETELGPRQEYRKEIAATTKIPTPSSEHSASDEKVPVVEEVLQSV